MKNMQICQIQDETLCCQQQTQKALSFRARMEIIGKLIAAGVNLIALPIPENEKADALLLDTVAPLGENVCYVISVSSVAQAQRAAAVLMHAAHARLCVELPLSAIGMEYSLHKKEKDMIGFVTDLISSCRTLCNQVSFCAADAFRADVTFLKSAVQAAVSAGADTVILKDNAGIALPWTTQTLFQSVAQQLPASVCLGAAFSNTAFMACANSACAVRSGAVILLSAIGSNTLPDTAALWYTMQSLSHTEKYTTALVTTELSRLCDAVRAQLCGVERTTQQQRTPEQFRLTKDASATEVAQAARTLGYDLCAEDADRLYEAFRRVSEKKTVDSRELDALIASETMQVRPTYTLEKYLVNAGNVMTPAAQITLRRGEDRLQGISMGDGPIDAAFLTIEQIIGCHFELDAFEIQAVTEGRGAMGSAVVRLRADGKLYSGMGSSTDIIGASIRAYLNAINKIVYDEMQSQTL